MKVGDTLIEVVLAIGIFSMVAIAVVAVISGATSSAQSNLESTAARQEIDSQAEALRFIHNAYVASVNAGIDNNYKYDNLWKAIKSRAITEKEDIDKYINYQPATCQEIYSGNNLQDQKAFIIDHRNLALTSTNLETSTTSTTSSVNWSKDIITFAPSNKFKQAATYPRLVFSEATENDTLLGQNVGQTLSAAEGIYIIALKDTDTEIVSNAKVESAAAYYNFYIRSCWYNPGSEHPSTISTVVRLYDPDITQIPKTAAYTGKQVFNSNEGLGNNQVTTVRADDPDKADQIPTPTRTGYIFNGWNTQPDGKGQTYTDIDVIPNEYDHLFGKWTQIGFAIKYDANGGSYAPTETECKGENPCYLSNSTETSRSGYKFMGWCSVRPTDETCSGIRKNPGDRIYPLQMISNPKATNVIQFYAIWSPKNEKLTVVLTWGSSPNDLDAHVEGQKSDNSIFHAYYSEKVGSDITGLTIAELDRDDTNGYGPETFVINTLGGKNYYYYVHNYSKNSTIKGATVTLTIPSTGTRTYYSNDATGTGRYWNVFAYKDGKVIDRQQHSSSAQTSY